MGDIIITGPTPAKICVRINNLNDFPDIAVIGLSDCVALSNSNKAYRVEPDSFLKVYKSCPLSLYVMKVNYLKNVDLDKIDWNKDENVKKLNLTVNANSFNSNDCSAVIIDYNLASFKDTTLYLYKTEITYKYKDKRPDAVQSFKNDADPFKPISVSTKNASR